MTKRDRPDSKYGCLTRLGIFLICIGGICGLVFHEMTNGHDFNPFVAIAAIGVVMLVIIKWATSKRNAPDKAEKNHSTKPAPQRHALRRQSVTGRSGFTYPHHNYDHSNYDEGFEEGRAQGYERGLEEGHGLGFEEGRALGHHELDYEDHVPEGAEWRDPDDDPVARD